MKPAKPTLKTSIEPFLDDFRNRKITGRALAAKLGVTESWVSKTLKELGVTRPIKPSREEERNLSRARRAHRVKAALSMSVNDAAKACNVHPRTITRLLKKLKD